MQQSHYYEPGVRKMTLSAIQALVLVQLFGSILGNDEKTDNYFLVPFLCTIITEHPQTPRTDYFLHTMCNSS